MEKLKKNKYIIATYITDNDNSWLIEKFQDEVNHTFNKVYNKKLIIFR